MTAIPPDLVPIQDVAEALGLMPADWERYGAHVGKVDLEAVERVRAERPRGRLVLVTGMTPTRFGEGKTVTSIGLAQALRRGGVAATPVLRQPSLGPTLGMKGGATGGGAAQVRPATDINLHFTGDIYAIQAANNLLAAQVDNHLYWGNERELDPDLILFRRALDMNDRALRRTVVGLSDPGREVSRTERWVITAASEVMALFSLARDLEDLQARLDRIVVGFTRGGAPVKAEDLGVTGAMAALLRRALGPNLVQTAEGTPALVHGGPFANIAHGTASLLATELALRTSDVAVVEAGFGSDMGAEKFLHIVAPAGDLRVDAGVLVVTVRAVKFHGGVPIRKASEPDGTALEEGFDNVAHHLEILRTLGVRPVVAVNRFADDDPRELEALVERARDEGCPAAIQDAFARGGAGAEELAVEVRRTAQSPKPNRRVYAPNDSLTEKLTALTTRIYGGADVKLAPRAENLLERYEALGYGTLPLCVAKTQYSLSHDRRLRGRPRDWTLAVDDVRLAAGAGFVVPVAGHMNLLPGLGPHPAAESLRLTEDGEIAGLR